MYCTFILAVFCFSFFTYFQRLFSNCYEIKLFSITTLVTSLSRIVPKCTQNVFDGIKINFQVGRSLLVRAAWIPLISASPLCKNEQQRLMVITWLAVLAPESSDKGVSRKASKRVSCHQVAMVGSVRSLYLLFALQICPVQLDLIGR